MLKCTQAHGSKHKHGSQANPNPRRLGQRRQSIKTWQKVRRHARKAIEHARKQDKAKNMLGKDIKNIMNKDKAKGVDCN